ncbi:hypothetical protein [Streptomyces sp. 5-10]|uniref:hypothetical protein n=1 Tax=Streptomyces sp. 5-10 TaxID=878925 RepID=UPI00168AAAD9|nr:hypothetical protein [Streptomyces sp. 5-10]MBD3004615.1 hypothetical protein [Streptomyces sp. 5-10]
MAEHVSAWYLGGMQVVGGRKKAVGIPITTGLEEVKWMKLPPEEALKMAREILDKVEQAVGAKVKDRG